MVAERTPWLVEIERVRVRERETNTRALTIAEWLLFRRAFYFGLRCSNIFVFFWQKFLSLFTFMSNFQLLKYYMVFFIFINRQRRQQQSTRACASLSIKRMFVTCEASQLPFCRLWLFFFLFILFAKIKIITNVKISFLRKKRRRRRRKFCGRFCLIYYIEYVMPLDGRQVLSYNLFLLL